jgi:hypothetical protein
MSLAPSFAGLGLCLRQGHNRIELWLVTNDGCNVALPRPVFGQHSISRPDPFPRLILDLNCYFPASVKVYCEPAGWFGGIVYPLCLRGMPSGQQRCNH